MSYQMSFFIQFGRGFAEVKILKKKRKKKETGLYFFDNISHTHWYWHDLAQTDCQIQLANGRN